MIKYLSIIFGIYAFTGAGILSASTPDSFESDDFRLPSRLLARIPNSLHEMVESSALAFGVWFIAPLLPSFYTLSDIEASRVAQMLGSLRGGMSSFTTSQLIRLLSSDHWRNDGTTLISFLESLEPVVRGMCPVDRINTLYALSDLVLPARTIVLERMGNRMSSHMERMDKDAQGLCLQSIAKYCLRIPHFGHDFRAFSRSFDAFLDRLERRIESLSGYEESFAVQLFCTYPEQIPVQHISASHSIT